MANAAGRRGKINSRYFSCSHSPVRRATFIYSFFICCHPSFALFSPPNSLLLRIDYHYMFAPFFQFFFKICTLHSRSAIVVRKKAENVCQLFTSVVVVAVMAAQFTQYLWVYIHSIILCTHFMCHRVRCCFTFFCDSSLRQYTHTIYFPFIHS